MLAGISSLQITYCECALAFSPRDWVLIPFVRVLFIVSVLATAWALVTLFRRDSTRRSAHFVAAVDLAFFGALIAGVYELRGIAGANCSNISGGFDTSGGISSSGNTITVSPLTINYSPFSISANKSCALLKASFALGIINVILFFFTACLAALMHRREKDVVVKETTYRRRSHDSR